MAYPSSPIVVLDSGLGGLTVARALRKVLPQEDILYFGDTARVPYGSKTAPTVRSFVRQIIRFFLDQRPKHVVIACNTATALALPHLRSEFRELSISGVIEPGARAAVEAAGRRDLPLIGLIATEATIRSGAYEKAIARRRMQARLMCRATPLLVPIIEEGRAMEDPLVRLALRQYLLPLYEKRIDVLLLGCTHYPVFKGLIMQMVGRDIPVIDSAEHCAEDVARRLRLSGMLRRDGQRLGHLRCFVTDDPLRFARLAPRFLGFAIPPPTWVCTEELYRLGAQVDEPELRSAV